MIVTNEGSVLSEECPSKHLMLGNGDTLEITSNTGETLCVTGVTKTRTSFFWMTLGALGAVVGMLIARSL